MRYDRPVVDVYEQAAVSCAHCFDKTSDEQKTGYRERQKQVELASARWQTHIGVAVAVKKPDA